MEKLYISLGILFVLISVGTFAYHNLEGWSWVDSLYFSTTSITTGGSGMQLTNDIAKVFTVFYIISGLSTAIYALANIGEYNRPAIEHGLTKTFKTFNGKFPPPPSPPKL